MTVPTPAAPDQPTSSVLDRWLRPFTEVGPGEGATGLLLLANIFLVLAAYYLIKPVREGWLAISPIPGLSKLEVKAYTSFGQSLLLLAAVPSYTWLARRLPRGRLITASTLFFAANLVGFWALRPGFLAREVPHAGVAFYLWVGIFSVAVVAQFWAFAADLYTPERGRRLFPLIAVGATAGAAVGSWFTERLIRAEVVETFDLLLLAIAPLLAALALSLAADRRGTAGHASAERRTRPAAPDPGGILELLLHNRYALAAATLGLLLNWVNTSGENILYAAVQSALEGQFQAAGVTDPKLVARFVKDGTTAFYGNLYLWVNVIGLVLQAFFVSRLLKYGGLAAILFLTPLVSLFSYALMAAFPLLAVIRWMKIAENSTNYSVNNTARHVLWLPTSPSVTYKGKIVSDTLFARTGDGLAALTVLVGTRALGLSLTGFLLFNVALVLAWLAVAAYLVRENRRMIAPPGSVEGRATLTSPTGAQVCAVGSRP